MTTVDEISYEAFVASIADKAPRYGITERDLPVLTPEQMRLVLLSDDEPMQDVDLDVQMLARVLADEPTPIAMRALIADITRQLDVILRAKLLRDVRAEIDAREIRAAEAQLDHSWRIGTLADAARDQT